MTYPATLYTAPTVVGSLDPHLFEPTAQRPVRAKLRRLAAATHVSPHSHSWAQVAMSEGGVIRFTTESGSYLVPPLQALWIPPGMRHAVTVLDDADLRTLYLYVPRGRCGPAAAPLAQADAWRGARLLEMSPLLYALVREMPTQSDLPAGEVEAPGGHQRQRERHLSALVRQELASASTRRLEVELPRDKRLRQLCDAVLAEPTQHATLADWARGTGASPRTVARLFQSELQTTFSQWHQQVVLAKAVSLAARNWPIAHIAAALGYSPSAFSAMVRRSVGQTPAQFLRRPARGQQAA